MKETKIQAYREEFSDKNQELREKYNELIREEIIRILKQKNLYEVPVIYKRTQEKGKIDMQKTSNGSVGYELIFVPLKKNGEYSKKHLIVYETFPQSYDFEKKLKEVFEA